MAKVHSLLFWFRDVLTPEDPLLIRLEAIRGHRLDLAHPTVSAFSRRRGLQPTR